MKKKINNFILSFFLALFLPLSVFAADICGDRVYINITVSGDCGEAPSECLPVTGCTVGEPANISCIAYTCEVCCPDTFNTQRDDTDGSQIILDVPVGDEQETAQTAFNNWSSTHNFQDAPPDYTMTGTMEGYVYNTIQSDTPGTVDLNLRFWKRGFYTKAGTAEVTPIENLGSGDAAGTIKTGVGDAIDEKFGTLEGTGGTMVDSQTTQGFVTSADQGDFNTTLPGTVVEDSITTKVTNFLTSNPALAIFRDTQIDAEAVEGSCSYETEIFGGAVALGFEGETMETILAMFGTIQLIVATIYSLLIAMGRA